MRDLYTDDPSKYYLKFKLIYILIYFL
jgi:hypothetical protein